MNKPIFLFIFIGLLIAGVLLVWDSPSNMRGDAGIDLRGQQLPPEAQATGAVSRYFDDLGELSYTFRAARLRHFLAQPGATSLLDNSDELLSSFTNIDAPLLTFYNEDSMWHIKADEALVQQSGKVMLFERNVVLWQQQIIESDMPLVPEAATNKNVKLTTESLTIEPDARIAYTDDAVTIASPLGKVDATGMKADMTTRKIKLKNSVKGNYQRNLGLAN